MLALTVNLEHVTQILRAHGFSAYEQGREIVVYAVNRDQWLEVARLSEDSPLLTGGRTDEDVVASRIAHYLADLVSGPHTHEVLN